MQSICQHVWLIPALPYLASMMVGLSLLFMREPTRSQRSLSSGLITAVLGVAMVLSLVVMRQQIGGDSAHCELWSWVSMGGISLQVGYLVDPLGAMMLVLVTTVGVVVMVYASGYMLHDEGYVRFFVYLGLFTASMLGLILSPNLVQMYVFWELVGMCSYLLIGFWFTRTAASYASQKAFVTNRIGDFGLLLGILGLYYLSGGLEFDTMAGVAREVVGEDPKQVALANVCCILLFLGPIAKSAQFPLHVWLPDAMEGPTPISALIHAATMVAAGVFLTARLLPLFEQFPLVMDIVAWTGGVTALLGATVALMQMDLKRGLAYSTMSQLGYMMLALGIGSYRAGLLHLVTHAYSKALLFLCAGSVIHGMESVVGNDPNKSQDMRSMGGLRTYMPVTSLAFLLGTLSLCGIPPFACFWSKDEILADAWLKWPTLGWVAWLTAGITAFYMFRMYFVTFEGKLRGCSGHLNQATRLSQSAKPSDLRHSVEQDESLSSREGLALHPHEPTAAMVAPLVILMLPTSLIGLIGVPFPSGVPKSDWFSLWLHLRPLQPDTLLYNRNEWIAFIVTASPSVAIGLVGAFSAWALYGPRVGRLSGSSQPIDAAPSGRSSWLIRIVYSWCLNRGYIDQLYNNVFVVLLRSLADVLSVFDQWFVDGVVNVGGLLALWSGETARYGEVGRTTAYLFGLVAALVALVFVIALTAITSPSFAYL